MASYVINKDLLSKTVGEQEVLVDLNSGTYFGMNPLGTFIWNLLKQDKSKSEIITLLCENFSATEDEILSDFDSFLEILEQKKFISAVEAVPANP